MKLRLTLSALSLALFACYANAQAPAGAPAGANGQCKDGTYSMAASKSGACGGHKGVQTWFGPAAAPKTAAAPAAKPAPAPAPAAAAKPAPVPAPKPAPAPAASAAGAPAGANGVCNDGTYSMAASKSGACGGHKGVKTWFAAATPPPAPKAAPAPPAPKAAPAPPAPTAAAPPPPAAPKAAPAPPAAPKTSLANTPVAGGGGPGMVWVNTATKVYHCPTDRYYGKTKAGKYVTESAAIAEGDKADAGKACK